MIQFFSQLSSVGSSNLALFRRGSGYPDNLLDVLLPFASNPIIGLWVNVARQCDVLRSLWNVDLLVRRPCNVLGIRLNGSVRRLERDLLYDIVDLVGGLLNDRLFLVIHGILQSQFWG